MQTWGGFESMHVWGMSPPADGCWKLPSGLATSLFCQLSIYACYCKWLLNTLDLKWLYHLAMLVHGQVDVIVLFCCRMWNIPWFNFRPKNTPTKYFQIHRSLALLSTFNFAIESLHCGYSVTTNLFCFFSQGSGSSMLLDSCESLLHSLLLSKHKIIDYAQNVHVCWNDSIHHKCLWMYRSYKFSLIKCCAYLLIVELLFAICLGFLESICYSWSFQICKLQFHCLIILFVAAAILNSQSSLSVVWLVQLQTRLFLWAMALLPVLAQMPSCIWPLPQLLAMLWFLL